jgi:hypothetical protein
VGEQLGLLTDLEKPEWFSYPNAFLRFAECGIFKFPPWRLLDPKSVLTTMSGLSQRFPGRTLLPFALRTDCDDIACWERDRGALIVIVHDFASPGWEHVGEFEDFWSWFKSAVDDFATFEND